MIDETSTAADAKSRPALSEALLSKGTFLSRDLDRLSAFCEDVLGLQTIRISADRLGIRDRATGQDGQPFWMLEANAVDRIENPQEMANHWGITVDTDEKVDRVYKISIDRKQYYGLVKISKPRDQHGSYSFYMSDGDSNWWEVECRAPGKRYHELPDIMGDSHK